VHVVNPGGVVRLLPLALAGLFAVSACSVLPADLAVVPGAAVTAIELPAATVGPSPAPAATPAPARQVSSEAADKKQGQPNQKKGRSNAPPETKVLKLRPRPKAGPFEMNLYRKGDFMHQATKDMCVAGSTQIMMNIIDPGKPNRSVAFQKKLYERGRRLSPNQAKLGPIGVDLTGWAELLNTSGYGPYVVESAGTRRGAIRKAARAIRQTGRPVGLVTWRGAHSWVMSGFTANADPAYDNGFKVKAAYIQDTWYPYVSTIWGASRPPNALVPVAALAEDYLPYARPRARYPKRDGKFMLILPVLPPDTVVR
jgi:hypothetical protein